MNLLEKAIAIAVGAHRNQKDKAGAPYILHPLRIMLQMKSDEERIAAVLHDVVEDSDWTLEELKEEGFPGAIIAAVDCLTRRAGESYTAFVKRAGKNPLARKVKRADLVDNLDIMRMKRLSEKDRQRLNRYLNALKTLDSGTEGWVKAKK